MAEQEVDTIDPESKAILQTYADGVHAYLNDHQGTPLALEHNVLKLLTPDCTVEPRTPPHSLPWAKTMAWDLRGNMDEEGDREVLLRCFSAEQAAGFLLSYPKDHPHIVNGKAAGTSTGQSSEVASDVDQALETVVSIGSTAD